MKSLPKRIEQWVRPNVLAMKPYSSAKSEFNAYSEDWTFLDANESPYNNTVNRYPDPGQQALKEAIATIKGLNTEQMILGNGSDEVLDMIFRVFFEPGIDNIVINLPTFGMFKVLAQVNNVELQEVAMTTDFELDLKGIKEAINKNTKAVFVCSPNNPTGNAIPKEQIQELIALDLLVVVDEAYIDFSDKGSWIQMVNDYENLIVTQTFSKAYGMAGLRMGLAYAQRPVVELLKKVKMPYNLSSLVQNEAIQRLSEIDKIKDQIGEILSERDRLIIAMKEISFIVEIFPTDSNFVLIRVDDADKRYLDLQNKSMIVRNRSKELHCENCLRVTVGTPLENKTLIELLKNMQQ